MFDEQRHSMVTVTTSKITRKFFQLLLLSSFFVVFHEFWISKNYRSYRRKSLSLSQISGDIFRVRPINRSQSSEILQELSKHKGTKMLPHLDYSSQKMFTKKIKQDDFSVDSKNSSWQDVAEKILRDKKYEGSLTLEEKFAPFFNRSLRSEVSKELSRYVEAEMLNRLDYSAQKMLIYKMKQVAPFLDSKNISWGDVADKILQDEGYESRLPDVINIGAKKAGTGALMTYLRFHPQIQISTDGYEVHYFDRYYDKGIKWYESRLNLAKKSQLVYEKTPRYFVTKSAPYNIRKDISSKLRFILCVRDPVSRLISDFHFSKTMRSSQQWRHNQTAESETKRLKDEILTANFVLNESSPYVYTSDYATHFQNWLKVFEREQFWIIENDEMRADVLDELRKVEKFLGIDSYFTKDMFVQENGCFKSERNILCPGIVNDKQFPLPILDEVLEKLLRDYFRPRNKEFEQLTGRSYKWTNL